MEGSPYRKFSISWKGARFQGPNSGFLFAGTWGVPLSGTRGALRADLASRLQLVKFHSLYELAEIAVNVEEGMEKEKAMMKYAEPLRRTEGLGKEAP
ncbi:hypothetical protein DY000_02053897 [Brassica cretica]|uniref:Uncharacterized protein n=1 Tax=Brassica cretica TaxID=69181 RepID=A0ABQ7A6D6_BRACR|nr:hypothetical protein DY000_02053897 [Brassica cretica]